MGVCLENSFIGTLKQEGSPDCFSVGVAVLPSPHPILGCPPRWGISLRSIKEKGEFELYFSSLHSRWSSFIWQQMAQNYLKSGFPPTAQGRRFPSGLEAGGFTVSTAWWLFPSSYFTVRFRYVELEAQLLNESNAYLYNTSSFLIWTF